MKQPRVEIVDGQVRVQLPPSFRKSSATLFRLCKQRGLAPLRMSWPLEATKEAIASNLKIADTLKFEEIRVLCDQVQQVIAAYHAGLRGESSIDDIERN